MDALHQVERETRGAGRRLRLARFGFTRAAGRILPLQLAGLAALLVLTLIMTDARGTLTDARLTALLTTSDTMVAALSEMIDPGDASGESAPFDVAAMEARLAEMLAGAALRGQIFGPDGVRLIDSTVAGRRPGAGSSGPPKVGERLLAALASFTLGGEPPGTGDATVPSELMEQAASGVKVAALRLVDGAFPVVMVAAPVRDEIGQPMAVLTLETAPSEIAPLARAQELRIVFGFLLAAVVLVAVVLAVSAFMARPLVSLVRTAERIADGHYDTAITTVDLPGEIGQLSRALDDMTQALYLRIDAIESFAGDVAHELKNPLTSLRSAVETLPLARSQASRDALLDVIQHDVRRIDRLISDISDASKLDAELNRRGYEQFALDGLLEAVVSSQNEVAQSRNQRVTLATRGAQRVGDFDVEGNKSRLGQVFTNLIDNARSFTPAGGTVSVTATRFGTFIEVVVDDEGPGIAEELLERIFERFYTDRSEQQSFGDNSGLGLAISRQIVNAHGGEMFAENRYTTSLGPNRKVRGARLTVRLPLAR